MKPQAFCNQSELIRSLLNSTEQDEVIFNLSTYLPLFHALESLNRSFCAAQLSEYLCLKKFQYCTSGKESGGCSRNIYTPFRERCLYFTDASSPCSLSRINTTLQNAGYNIPIVITDFDCSKLPPSEDEGYFPDVLQLSRKLFILLNEGNFLEVRITMVRLRFDFHHCNCYLSLIYWAGQFVNPIDVYIFLN